MNVWVIQIGEHLPINSKAKKMRTAILADTLIEKGHCVVWWTSAFDHFKKEWIVDKDSDIEVKKGLKIVALKGAGYKKNISLSRLLDHRIVAAKFRERAGKMPKPDIIIASMPPHDLAYTASAFAKKNGIPILVDIRDEWPDLFLTIFPKILQKVIKMLFFYDFWMIKKTMRMADGLLAVSNDLLQWGLDYAGRKAGVSDKVFYLGSRKISYPGKQEGSLDFLDSLKNKFVVTFIGTFVQNNNPAILVDCARRIKDKNITFVLVGSGELYEKIKKMSRNLDNLLLPGWLHEDEINVLLKYCHVGVCPTSITRSAFPNKSFLYLSANLPIISSFQGDLKDILEKYQLGLYYPPNDTNALVNCVKKLYNDKVLYDKMSKNANKVFAEVFDTDIIYSEYARHIEKFVREHKHNHSKVT